MNAKPVIIIIGLIILAQVLMFNYMQQQNIAQYEQSIINLDSQNRQLASEKAVLVAKMKEMRATIEMIPPWLLTGFEDPETGFVEFLDFLQSPEIQEVRPTIKLGRQQLLTSPIPVHSTDFGFSFDMPKTYEAEKFLNFLLFQERFPLQVTKMAAKRAGEGKVTVDMDVSLLIPARLNLELPASQKEAEVK